MKKKYIFLLFSVISVIFIVTASLLYYFYRNVKDKQYKNISRYITPTSSINESNYQINKFQSKLGKIEFSFPQPLYVNEKLEDKDGGTWKEGRITISNYLDSDQETSNLTVVFGIPFIDGKGGICGNGGYQTQIILNQPVSVCDTGSNLFGGYPKHPDGSLEYSFFIGGNNITLGEFKMYKEIIYSNIEIIK